MDSRKVADGMGLEFDEGQDHFRNEEWFDIDTFEPGRIEKSPSTRLISKTMLISEIVNEHPDIVPEIMSRGMHCVGCGASAFETLEEGFMMHGMDPAEIDKTISELNKIIDNNSKPERLPDAGDDFF